MFPDTGSAHAHRIRLSLSFVDAHAVNRPLEIDCATVQTLLDDGTEFLFLDCREADEYATARIEGTVLLPMSELTERVAELTPHQSRLVVVHCHHGGRSLRVARWLRTQGFEEAVSLAGGIDLWSQTIDPQIPRY
mgnify:CR=1 FL=1